MSPSNIIHDYISEPLINTAQIYHDSAEPLRPNGVPDTQGIVEKILRNLDYMQQHGPPVTLADLPAIVDAVLHSNGRGLDDRKYFLEDLLTIMARTPPSNPLSDKLQSQVIGILYNDLPHPPQSYLGDAPTSVPPVERKIENGVAPTPTDGTIAANSANGTVSASNERKSLNRWNFRSANGSYYDRQAPTMGMARTAYARSVPQQHNVNQDFLPDPEEVFDRLLKRDEFVEHPGGISALFFAFANLVIHSIFNTSPDYINNNVSSYLDLSPLYGSSEDEQKDVRKWDGTGQLWDDTFADSRLKFMAPSTGALLVLMSRNHNYIAQKILAINEKRYFSKPPPSDAQARQEQDEEIFQRARLVNCGFFMQIILGDYVAAILGLVRDGVTWRLDPRINIREADHAVAATGRGNVCSIEFNLLYRWHATLSEPDTAWTQNELSQIMGGRDPSTMSVTQFKDVAMGIVRGSAKVPPKQWSFGGIQRASDGKFADADLARILQEATAASASAFKARGTPEALRFVEILSIEQSRQWGACSMNEFRKFMKLKPFESFEEWNPDPEISKAARDLYKNIENLELHVGLQAEAAKEVRSGAGLCPGFTISRAILADAVALVRGDRFMCDDHTPQNLTSWGYDYTLTDPKDGSYGGMLTRLLYTTLPDHYPAGSAYAHFPFLVPEKMKEYAKKIPGDVVSKYTWTKPESPVGPVIVPSTSEGARSVLEHPDVFSSAASERLDILTRGAGIDSTFVRKALYTPDMTERAAESFTALTQKLVRVAEHKLKATSYMDVVGDVLNLLPVHWICNEITGTELKTVDNLKGFYQPSDIYNAYAAASEYVYFNVDPAEDWTLREEGLQISKQVTDKVKQQIGDALSSVINPFPYLRSLQEWYTAANDHNDPAVAALCDALKGHDGPHARESLAASVFAEYVPTAPIFSKVMAHAVNFYLDAEHKTEREAIVALCESGHQDGKVLPYIYEAIRNDPALPTMMFMFTAKSTTTVEGQSVAAGQRVYVDLTKANLDQPSFLTSVVPENFSMETAFGLEARGLLDPKYFDKIAPRVLYEILKLPELHRRTTGTTGHFSRFTDVVRGVPQKVYRTHDSKLSPFPTRLDIEFTH